jgi:hypothetical protein
LPGLLSGGSLLPRFDSEWGLVISHRMELLFRRWNIGELFWDVNKESFYFDMENLALWSRILY